MAVSWKKKKEKRWQAAKPWRHINIPGLSQRRCCSNSSSPCLKNARELPERLSSGSASRSQHMASAFLSLPRRSRAFLRKTWLPPALWTRALDYDAPFRLVPSGRRDSAAGTYRGEPVGSSTGSLRSAQRPLLLGDPPLLFVEGSRQTPVENMAERVP